MFLEHQISISEGFLKDHLHRHLIYLTPDPHNNMRSTIKSYIFKLHVFIISIIQSFNMPF